MYMHRYTHAHAHTHIHIHTCIYTVNLRRLCSKKKQMKLGCGHVFNFSQAGNTYALHGSYSSELGPLKGANTEVA